MQVGIVPIVIAALVISSACGDDGPRSGAALTPSSAANSSVVEESSVQQDEAGATVTISQSRFDNVELRIAAGTTVTFVNTDPFAHTITSKDGAASEFDSGTLNEGETFEFRFDAPGEYPYFCEIHPTMRAVVIVE